MVGKESQIRLEILHLTQGLGRGTMGSSTQFHKNGGFNQAQSDFHSLRPTNIRIANNGARVGDLSGARTVILRSSSSRINGSGGFPTLEIQLPNGSYIKIRY